MQVIIVVLIVQQDVTGILLHMSLQVDHRDTVRRIPMPSCKQYGITYLYCTIQSNLF